MNASMSQACALVFGREFVSAYKQLNAEKDRGSVIPKNA